MVIQTLNQLISLKYRLKKMFQIINNNRKPENPRWKKQNEKIKKYLKNLFNIRLDMVEQQELDQTLK